MKINKNKGVIMMRKNGITLYCFLLLTLSCSSWVLGNQLEIKLEKELELGSTCEMFFSLGSMCEDDQGNIYILDRKAYKVRKFSKDGKELTSFGRKGAGPGEFKSPSEIYFSKDIGLVITETMNEASIFTLIGEPVKKINFAAHFGMLFFTKYLGDDVFYAEKQGKDRIRHQFLIDTKGNMVSNDFFSSKPWSIEDANGYRYSMNIRELTPMFVFASTQSYGLIGITDRYDLKILDTKGKVTGFLKRKIPKEKVTKREKEYFIERIQKESKNWTPTIKKKFIEKIPQEKMYFYKAIATVKNIFIVRLKKETNNDAEPYPLDVFNPNGDFLGEVKISKIPLFISEKNMYWVVNNQMEDDEILILEKYKYQLVNNVSLPCDPIGAK